MDPIVESTRRQNTASAQLAKIKLDGLDRHTAGSGSYVAELPEIVVISVPDANAHHALTDGADELKSAATATLATDSRQPIRRTSSSSSFDNSTRHSSGPASPVLRGHHLGTQLDRPGWETAESAASEIDGIDEQAGPSAVETASHSIDSQAPVSSDVDGETTSRIDLPTDDSSASDESPRLGRVRKPTMPIRKRLFSGLFPRRSQPTSDEANVEPKAESPLIDEATQESDELATAESELDPALAGLTNRDAMETGLPRDAFVANESAETSSPGDTLDDSGTPVVVAAVDDVTLVASEDLIESDLEATQTLESDKVEHLGPTPEEIRAREADARERHGRTIARRLFEHPAIANASTLLLVATGGVRRALDAVECIGRGIAWHQGRNVELVSLETYPEAIWEDLPNALPTGELEGGNEQAIETLGNLARVTRVELAKRLTSIELAVEQHPDSQRLTAQDLQRFTQAAKSENRCLTWLVDAERTDWCEVLGAACDSTLMLVDLQSSRVDQSRWAVTHLRDHGARIVGSLVINAYEEQD